MSISLASPPPSEHQQHPTTNNAADALGESIPLEPLLGSSAAMREVDRLIRKVAPTDITVLIEGESGSGKELVAQTIHALSPRAARTISTVNCGAIAENLIASELFGHERGSFTGATRAHQGYFERCSGGTLFLDEITEMPLDLQANLLRVLETGRIVRVGGLAEIAVDVRIVAATNRQIQAAVRSGHLREDLYFRLQGFPIRLPPLRERRDEIIALAKHFLALFKSDKPLSAEAEQVLLGYPWPGNVRELRNAIERAALLADGAINPADLMLDALVPRFEPRLEPINEPSNEITLPVTPAPAPLNKLRHAEKQLILDTLAECGGNKQESARRLGISVKTVYNKLNGYADADSQLDSRTTAAE